MAEVEEVEKQVADVAERPLLVPAAAALPIDASRRGQGEDTGAMLLGGVGIYEARGWPCHVCTEVRTAG